MKKSEKIKLFLADDQELVRTGLKVILESEKDIVVIGEANTGEDLLQKIQGNEPHVVLIDIKMPGIGGLETAKRLLKTFPQIGIVVVTGCSFDPYPEKLIQLGVLGFIAKNSSAAELISAIKKAAKGERYVSAEIAQALALRKTPLEKKSRINDVNALLSSSIPHRELQVLIMLAKGFTINDIAQKLAISSKTVNTYRYRLYKRLKVNTDVLLTHVAIQQGWVSVDESGNILTTES